ncbi:MAG TPA: hypothetical protein VGQ58_03615 [Candidatus Limnocylindrales bacterium]|nr:hypothetical protein [Candidatus Limnocylindrales bacterium]
MSATCPSRTSPTQRHCPVQPDRIREQADEKRAAEKVLATAKGFGIAVDEASDVAKAAKD